MNLAPTPKEKANELITKFAFQTISDLSDENFEQTKQCAIICLNEILEATNNKRSYILKTGFIGIHNYYLEVGKELAKL